MGKDLMDETESGVLSSEITGRLLQVADFVQVRDFEKVIELAGDTIALIRDNAPRMTPAYREYYALIVHHLFILISALDKEPGQSQYVH